VNDHARATARIWAGAAVRVVIAAALWFALAIGLAIIALADPGPFVPGSVADCAGHAVPLDPRVSVQNPLGTLMFEAMLHAMCGGQQPQQPGNLSDMLAQLAGAPPQMR
jgi:hypothetical protein